MFSEGEKTVAGSVKIVFYEWSYLSRYFEILAAISALLVFSPLLFACALLIRFSSGAGIFFRQSRIGLGGEKFCLYKFRTMRQNAAGPGITAANDVRITPVGKFLRRAKFDELPQLYNILRGDMSFVGPRPEIPEMVDLADTRWLEVLGTRPGITDPVTLEFRNEENLLAGVDDKLAFYRDVVQPYKLEGYLNYVRTKNFLTDLRIIFRTAQCVIFPSRAPVLRLEFSGSRSVISQTDEKKIIVSSDEEMSEKSVY